MVDITDIVWTEDFVSEVKKVKGGLIKERIKKQIRKIVDNPEAGKPLRFNLKGERTIYIKPYRLIYAVIGSRIYLLKFEHRKEVYGD